MLLPVECDFFLREEHSFLPVPQRNFFELMQSSIRSAFSFTRCLFLTAAATLTASHAEIVNQVTVTGTMTYPTESIRRQNSSGITNSQRLTTMRFTNKFFLDRMASDRMIPSTRNYQLVEILEDNGEPIGLFAYNARTGDAVEAGPSILNVFYENTEYTSSYSDQQKFSSRGDVYSFTTDQLGVADASVLGNPAHTFFKGKITGTTKPFFEDDVEWEYSSLKNEFEAYVRGMTEAGFCFDIKVTSKGGRNVNVYLEPR